MPGVLVTAAKTSSRYRVGDVPAHELASRSRAVVAARMAMRRTGELSGSGACNNIPLAFPNSFLEGAFSEVRQGLPRAPPLATAPRSSLYCRTCYDSPDVSAKG